MPTKKVLRASVVLICFVIITATVLTVFPQSRATADSPNSMTVVPPETEINVGDTFEVKIVINVDYELEGQGGSSRIGSSSAQCGLRFNKDVLKCTSVKSGGIFEARKQELGGGYSVMTMPTASIDNSAGEITYQAEFLTPAPDEGVNGEGIFISYEFEAMAMGQSTLELVKALLNDADGYPIEGAQYINGTVVIGHPPTVETGQPIDIGASSVTLVGNLTSLGDFNSVNASFEWGQSTDYGKTTNNQQLTETGTFTAVITEAEGLDINQVYHFRAVVQAEGINPTYGMDISFETPSGNPPVISTGSPQVTGDWTATLIGNLEDMGSSNSVDVSFKWGETTGYGNATGTQTMTSTGQFSYDLTKSDGLIPGMTYHYLAVAQSEDGASVLGLDSSFTMTAEFGDPPIVVTGSPSDIEASQARLHGKLQSVGSGTEVTVWIEWGKTDSYGNSTELLTMTSPGSFSFVISGLIADTKYHYRARAIGYGGGTGIDASFTTMTDFGLEASSVTLRATIPPTICLVVSPDKIDFGEITPATYAVHSIKLENCGFVSIDVEAEVSGDKLFKDGIELAGVPWKEFSIRVPNRSSVEGNQSPGQKNTTIGLNVPWETVDIGTYKGTVVFWAMATPEEPSS